jgi:Winged helix-turn-helix DNA-binding
MSILIHESLITDLLSNPALKKSDVRTILFLLQKPGALSSDELAAGVGVSKRAATKSVNRLIGAGVIQPGEYQAKRRTLNIPSLEQKEPEAVTEGTIKESSDTFTERFNRLEAMIGTIMDTLCAGFNPAPVDAENATEIGHIQTTTNHDGITDMIEQGVNVTQAVTSQAIEENAGDIQAEMMPGSDTERSKALWVITRKDTNETPNDTIVSDLDGAIIRAGARLAALKAASLLKEKQSSSFSDTCSPARAEDTFRELFGVNVPVGFTDMAAVGTMIARRKAGKLADLKSPLAYLSSLAGKVQSIITSPVQLPPVQVTTIHSVIDTSLDDYEQRSKIKAAWFGLNAEQRIPFHELREKKAMSGIPGRKVPVELLAFQQFTQECLAGRVQI